MKNFCSLNFMNKKVLLVTILLSIIFNDHSFAQSSDARTPNIIIIYADDLGYGDLSIYGGDIPTPNIDRIGKDGIRFTDFYVAGPVCTPSRYGLLTGSYPARSKQNLYTALMPFDKNHLDKSETIFPAYLKSHNYQTALIGKWHLGSGDKAFPTLYGFDVFTGFTGGCIDFFDHVYGTIADDWYVNGKPVKEEGYATDLITNHAIRFIDDVNKNSKPFFLYLPYNAPHYGKTDPDHVPANTVVLKEDEYEGYKIANTLQAPESYYHRFQHVEDPYRRAYSAMVSSLDDNVGRLYRKLEESGLLNNTIIWFISDNGGYSESYFGHASNGGLRGQKGTLYEGGIRVPALVNWRGKISPGQVISTPVGNVDLVPTFAALIGFQNSLPPAIDGKDIRSVLFENKPLQRDLFWKFRDQTALRSGDWKIVGDKELYNLREDRNEKNNVADEFPEKLRELLMRSNEIDQSAKLVR